MKLADRIAALEARIPDVEQPFNYDEYIELSKSLGNEDHPDMGPVIVNGKFNLHMADKVPVPEHCLSREEYDALIWSSADNCSDWVVDRCELRDKPSVAIFMYDRLTGDTVTTNQQRDALNTTFDGFDLSVIPVHHEMLRTDFICAVIEAFDVMRTKKRIAEDEKLTEEFMQWLGHRHGENPLHRKANERVRLHRQRALEHDSTEH